MRKRIFILLISLATVALSPGAFGQTTATAPPGALPPPDAMYVRTGGANFEFGGLRFVMFEGGFDRRTVTGAPFSAEAVTERIQTLANGNRIDQKTSAQIYRDSEGRTRRETKLNQIGPWGPQVGDAPLFISINDPVAGVHYVLNPREHTARELPAASAGKARLFDQKKITTAKAAEPGKIYFAANAKWPQAAKEDLGQQVIEGVTANGTRETMTIPAGAIGNEQPLKIVSERWYSPELQIDVMTRHDDPRFGETIYKLTNIDQSEPAATLFQVPPDYTITQSKGMLRLQDKSGNN